MKTAVKSTGSAAHSESRWFSRLDRRLALLLFALCLGIYSRTLAPGLLDGDAGEFQFAAWRFGLAHPTGYPLYLLLGGSWQRLAGLFGVEPAASLNYFSALLAALAVAIFYLAVLRWLPNRSISARIAALFAALLMGVNPTLWSQALVAEVYALHALFIALFFLITARFAQSPNHLATLSSCHPVILSSCHLVLPSTLLLGLSLTHHRTTLFLLPGLILWLFWRERTWWRRGKLWAALAGGLALPQLLYLYIPLRSGADASPWLYPRLGAETLALYTPTVQGFVDFITGSVFAVSFFRPAQALARLPEAAHLWLVHFTWPGLILVLLGLALLVRNKRWPLLLLTLPAALLLQIFNLFYGIGDIYVFYIPLYLIAALWAACGVDWLIGLTQRRQTTDDRPQTADDERTTHHVARSTQQATPSSQSPVPNPQSLLWLPLLLLLPASLLFAYFPAIDQSGNRAARQMWEAILAAPPPEDAILISNDRNEIVSLYYLQAVEGRAPGLTGIFPLLTPEDRFANVGAVTATALNAGDRPVYLIKNMPGLDARFQMESTGGPLVRVTGVVDAGAASQGVDRAYGPLTLLGYTLDAGEGGPSLALFWQVNARLDADYTTSVQLFDGAGNKLAQDDRPPGGVFYPTSLWKPGEILRDVHPLPDADLTTAAHMRVLMYTRSDSTAPLVDLAPALEIPLQ